MEHTSSFLDTAYRVLADRRRRLILTLFGDDGHCLTLNDLAKGIAVRERDRSITELSGDDLTRIYLSLQHVHVPTLDDAGFVEYDRNRSTVEPTGAFDRLVAFHRAVESALAEDLRPDDGPVA